MKLQTVTAELRKYFDTKGWIEDHHGPLLQERTLNKVNRMRAQMESRGDIIRSGSTYLSFAADLGHLGHLDAAADLTSGALASFDVAVSQLQLESYGQALGTLLDRVGHADASRMLKSWQEQNHAIEYSLGAGTVHDSSWTVSIVVVVDSLHVIDT